MYALRAEVFQGVVEVKLVGDDGQQHFDLPRGFTAEGELAVETGDEVVGAAFFFDAEEEAVVAQAQVDIAVVGFEAAFAKAVFDTGGQLFAIHGDEGQADLRVAQDGLDVVIAVVDDRAVQGQAAVGVVEGDLRRFEGAFVLLDAVHVEGEGVVEREAFLRALDGDVRPLEGIAVFFFGGNVLGVGEVTQQVDAQISVG